MTRTAIAHGRPLDAAPRRLEELLRERAECAPDAVALRADQRTITYAELWRASRAAAAELRATGPHGAPVWLALGNRPAFLVHFIGALLAGRVVTAAGPELGRAERAARLADARPAVVVTEARLVDTYREHGVPDVRVGAWPLSAPSDAPRPLDTESGVERGTHTVAVLQYTSGTTGGLKAAEMTHANLSLNAQQNNRWFGWTADDVILGALPLCHTWGLCCVLVAAVAAGAPIVLVERFEAGPVLDAIERHGVTVAYGSATMFDRLLDAAGEDAARRLGGLRYAKAGAMLVGGRLPERWGRAVPHVPMLLGYGLTEAGPEVSNNPPDDPRPGTVGVPLPGTSVRIADPDEPERVLAIGEQGEIQVRGPQVMRGYHGRPEASAAVLLAGGWLRTGDLGRLDGDGYLTVVDRLRDLIKFRGWSVVPARIERVLLGHGSVAECVVVGAHDETDGEIPTAYVVPRSGAPPRAIETRLRALAEAELSPHERPRAYRFVERIPKNAVGKPLRRVLREGC